VVQDTIADCENNYNGHEDSAATTSVTSVSR